MEFLDFTTFQTNTDNPSVWHLVFTLLMALSLSALVAFTYERTSRMVHRPDHFIQALVLASLVTTLIMLAIGDSVARGLGILGALAIIRFRTNIRDPRNIMFMFASLAIGIACGVYGFRIALLGTGFFCLAAFLLSWSPFNAPSVFLGELRFTAPETGPPEAEVHRILNTYCRESELRRLRHVKAGEDTIRLEYMYAFTLKRATDALPFREAFSGIDSLKDVRVSLELNQPTI